MEEADNAASLSDAERTEIKSLIEKEIKEIDFSSMGIQAEAELSEPTKAYITNCVSEEVQNIVAATPFYVSISDDEKAQIQSNVIEAVRQQLPDIVNAAVSESAGSLTNTTYTLTDADVETVKNAVLQSSDITSIVTQYFSSAYDENYMQQIITQAVMSRVDELAASGLRGADGYTPVKGVDYFTQDEINSIISQASSQGGTAPVKGVDYFTPEEIDGIVNEVVQRVGNGAGTGNAGSGSGSGYTPIKGVDYFTDEEIAEITDNITAVVETDLNGAIADIKTQVDSTSSMVSTMNTTVSDLQERLTEAESELVNAAQNNTATTDNLNAVAQDIDGIKTDIQTLQEKADSLEQNKLDLSTYNNYKANITANIQSLTQKDEELSGNIESLQTAVDDIYSTFEEVDEKLADYVTEESYTAFKASYNAFVSDTNTTINGLKTTCSTLSDTKLNKADFQTYQEQEAKALADLEDSLEENTLLLGDTDFSTEKYDTITGAVKVMQGQVDTFYFEYGDAMNDVCDDISRIDTVIGTKADGSVYEDYTGTLWQAAAELSNAVNELELADTSNKAELEAMISSLDGSLKNYITSTDTALSDIEDTITDMQEALGKKLDTTVFTAYQTTIDGKMANMQSSIDSLNTALADETTARKAKDDEIVSAVSDLNTAWETFKGTSTLTLADVEAELESLQNQINGINTSLANKANASHTHDERYYTETEINTQMSAIGSRLGTGARYVGVYQQQITLSGYGDFFQIIPAEYQNGGYFYIINCAGNSLRFVSNMEGYYMAVHNITTDTLSTTVQVYCFSVGM